MDVVIIAIRLQRVNSYFRLGCGNKATYSEPTEIKLPKKKVLKSAIQKKDPQAPATENGLDAAPGRVEHSSTASDICKNGNGMNGDVDYVDENGTEEVM